jgi:hypothetical protein
LNPSTKAADIDIDHRTENATCGVCHVKHVSFEPSNIYYEYKDRLVCTACSAAHGLTAPHAERHGTKHDDPRTATFTCPQCNGSSKLAFVRNDAGKIIRVYCSNFERVKERRIVEKKPPVRKPKWRNGKKAFMDDTIMTKIITGFDAL